MSSDRSPRARDPRSPLGGRGAVDRRAPRPSDAPNDARYQRLEKPPLRIQTTTLWDYPSQHYGSPRQGTGMQGDRAYVGATPSYIIWNVLQRYSSPGDLVIDPMCGSGTTLDVAKDLGRKGRGFDVAPYRPDIEKADARKLPVEKGSVQVVFVDPPYGDHIHYSEDPRCIGKLSAYDPKYYEEMGKVLHEAARVLKKDGVLAIYCCDYFEKKKGIACVGFELFALALRDLRPIDHIAVTRHHKTLEQGNYHKGAEEGNFYLRGFNHLFLLRKT